MHYQLKHKIDFCCNDYTHPEDAFNTYKVIFALLKEFEERLLFNKIQKMVSPEQLLTIEQIQSKEKFVDNLTDTFWE